MIVPPLDIGQCGREDRSNALTLAVDDGLTLGVLRVPGLLEETPHPDPTRRKISAQSIPGSSGAPPGVGPPTILVGAAAPGATLSGYAMRRLIA